MEKKIFYRVANTQTNQGLWYDQQGNFTGLIHKDFNFCTNNQLQMPFDEELVGWLSATDTLEELFKWFTQKDIEQLELFGYYLTEYEATDYKVYNTCNYSHLVINQESSEVVRQISILSLDLIKSLELC